MKKTKTFFSRFYLLIVLAFFYLLQRGRHVSQNAGAACQGRVCER